MRVSTPTLQTPRLLLRPWRNDDLAPFAALNADPRVMAYFPNTLSRAQSDAMVGRIRQHFVAHGYGLWALETRGGAPFIGFVGLKQVDFEAPFVPAVEVGWRLSFDAWGHGYASEGAREVLRFSFEQAGLEQVVSFTAAGNTRSRAVMSRIGLTHDPSQDFDHPRLAFESPLRRHVFYRISQSEFARIQAG